MSIHSERHLIAWVIDVLEDAGLTVGDAVAPGTVPVGAGYVVVYSIAGGVTEGSLDSPWQDATPTVQVTSSSFNQQQTRWLVDEVREAISSATPATLADGRVVMFVDFPMASVSIMRDDDVQPPRWYAPDRFEFRTG